MDDADHAARWSHRISHCKNQCSPSKRSSACPTPREERLAQLYRVYEERLKAAAA